MKQNDLEKLIREQLGADRPEVDTDKLWSSLEGQLPSRGKKRRGAIWWWLGGLSGMALVLWMVLPGTGANKIMTEPTQSMVSADKTEGVSTITDPAPMEQPKNEESLDRSLAKGDTQNEAAGTSQQSDPLSENQAILHNRPLNTINNPKPETAVMQGRSDLTGTGTAVRTHSGETGYRPESQESGGRSTKPVAGTHGDPVDRTALEPHGISAAGIQSGGSWPVTSALPQLIATNDPLESKLEEVSRELVVPAIAPAAKARNERRLVHSLGVTGGPGLSARTLSANGPAGTPELRLRDSVERVLENWSLGLGYRLNSGNWFVEAGLSAQWINESTDFSQTFYDSIWLGNVVIEQVMENGQVVSEVRGGVTIFEQTDRRMINYNKLTEIQLSLGIGRSWTLNKNWGLLTRGGLIYSLANRYKGTIAISDNATYDLTEDVEGRFPGKGMGLGAYAGIDARWSFHENWSLTAGVLARWLPSGITGKTANVHQRYDLYSLQFGVYRNF